MSQQDCWRAAWSLARSKHQTMQLEPDGQRSYALARGTVVHYSHRNVEHEAHLWPSDMVAKQQEREQKNPDEQWGKQRYRQDQRTLEEAGRSRSRLLQSVGQASDAHVIDRVNLGLHRGGAGITIGGIALKRAQHDFLSVAGKLRVNSSSRSS